MAEISFEDRVKGLRGWPNYDGPHDRAAVELLIWHESWLRRADFTEACVVQLAAGLVARVDWFKAERFAATVRIASSSERAILDLAVWLADRGDNWLKFRGDAHARAVVTAIAAAMDVDIVKPAPPVLDIAQRYDTEDARSFLARWDGLRAGSPDEQLSRLPPGRTEDILAGQVRRLLAIVDRVVPQGDDRG
jgi:hypothetical protein